MLAGGEGEEEGKGDRWAREGRAVGEKGSVRDCRAASRVGLKNTGFSLNLTVSRFNCLRLIVKLD